MTQGSHLGEAGGRIVAGAFMGVINADGMSYRNLFRQLEADLASVKPGHKHDRRHPATLRELRSPHPPPVGVTISTASPVFHLGLGAARQDLDAAVVAADRVAAKFTGLATHRARVGDGAKAAEDRRLHRP